MLLLQCQPLLYFLYLLIHKPIVCLLYAPVHFVVVLYPAEVEQGMHVLLVLKVAQFGLSNRPLLQHPLQLTQFFLAYAPESFAEQVFFRVTGSTGDGLDDSHLLIVDCQQEDELPGDFEANIVNFENKFALKSLDVEGRDDFPQEKLRVEDFLELEFLVANTLDPSIPCDQKALLLDLLTKMLNILCLEEISIASAAVGKRYLLTCILAQSLEEAFASVVGPVFCISCVVVDPKGYCIVYIFLQSQLPFLLLESVIN